jgi:hypothetical protein
VLGGFMGEYPEDTDWLTDYVKEKFVVAIMGILMYPGL